VDNSIYLTSYFHTSPPFVSHSRGYTMWRDCGVHAISRILYEMLITRERGKTIAIREDYSMGIVCVFTSAHRQPDWLFPDVTGLLSDVNTDRLDLFVVDDWVPVVWAIEAEFETIDEMYYVDD